MDLLLYLMLFSRLPIEQPNIVIPVLQSVATNLQAKLKSNSKTLFNSRTANPRGKYARNLYLTYH